MGIISKDSVIIKQVKNFSKINLTEIGNKAVKANEKELIILQQDQMRRGENSEGMNPSYTPYSLGLKQQSDTYFAPPPAMDFYNTGSFQDKMFIDKDGDFNSKDSKTSDLTSAYGDKILNPNKQTLEIGQSLTTADYFNLVHTAINK
jgi:hypothetical protein